MQSPDLRFVDGNRVLVYDNGRDGLDAMLAAYDVVREELSAYGPELENKPQILVLSKADACSAPIPAEDFRARNLGEVLVISAQESRGLEELVRAIFRAAGK